MNIPIILVCGGRNFLNKDLIFKTLDQLCLDRGWNYEPDQYGNYLPRVHILNGGATGADTLSTDWAVTNWCSCDEYKADWDVHGKAEGPIRNKEVLDIANPDVVVAFPGGAGTKHMIKIAKENGFEVIEVNEV